MKQDSHLQHYLQLFLPITSADDFLFLLLDRYKSVIPIEYWVSSVLCCGLQWPAQDSVVSLWLSMINLILGSLATSASTLILIISLTFTSKIDCLFFL